MIKKTYVLDLTKIFDTVDHDHIFKKLSNIDTN